jgi:phosphate acetyltransferase
MMFIDSVIEKLQRHPKRIVFPEGTEPRVLRAASEFVRLGLGTCVLLGNEREIEEVARAEGADLRRIHTLDPTIADDMPMFCRRLTRLPRFRDIPVEEARKILLNPNYLGAMMLQHGQVDGLVGGVSTAVGSLLRPLFSLVKPLPGHPVISSCMVMQMPERTYGDDGLFFFADCAVIPEPNVEQLASIALETAQISAQLTGRRPRVALLSYSTRGSAQTRHTEKITAATALARKLAFEQRLEIEVDGELQVDSAIVPEIAARKAPDSPLGGRANVLVFPDLNAGNIATKLVQRLASAESYGNILLGISKPAADISRGSSWQQVLGVAAIVGLRAIEYRKLYPEQGGAGGGAAS